MILQPPGIVAPGVLFGLALVCSIDASIIRLSAGQRTTIIAASTGGYIIAIMAALLSARLPGFDNGLLYGAYAGAIAGGLGAMIVATSLAIAVSALSPARTLLIVTMAGAIFGAVFMCVGIFISDRTPVGHPFDDFVSFPIWQVGVASVVLLCARSSNAGRAT